MGSSGVLGTDPDAAAVYAAEDAAVSTTPLRRYRRFTELCEHVDRIVCSDWWDATFPDAPIEVEVLRRSRNATFSAAVTHTDVDDAAQIVLINGRHWTLDVVLHELAHVGVGPGYEHGPVFRDALTQLWRQEAGIVATVNLVESFNAHGFLVNLR